MTFAPQSTFGGNMKHATRMRALKPLLLGSAALVIVGLQPAVSQDRDRMQPGAQNPGASQPQSPGGTQPAARENRTQPTQAPRAQQAQQAPRERGTTGQGSPSAQQPADPSPPRATQERDRARDAQSPKGDRQPTQSRERERARDNQAQPRDTERQRNQARERDTDRVRQRDQARDRDSDRVRDRDQARDRDLDRRRDRDQARDRDRRRDRDASRAGERRVSEQQRTRISTSIRQANVRPVRNVNFSLSVGAVVPASVRFYPVTPAIVEVYPEYRGYEFVLVEDDIVIVEPGTRRIVTVIDSGGGRVASRPRGQLRLSETQRDLIRRSAVERRTTGSASTTTIEEYEIGDDIPETVEIESFPETVYTEVPEIRSYRYVVRDDDVYVIDPSERRVIEIIR
jgi:hypothetical protein